VNSKILREERNGMGSKRMDGVLSIQKLGNGLNL
jgi:hypothetical protein